MYWLLIPQRATRMVAVCANNCMDLSNILWHCEVTDWHGCGAEDGCMIGVCLFSWLHICTHTAVLFHQTVTKRTLRQHCEIAAVTAVAGKVAVLRNVTPCSMLEVYRRFRWNRASMIYPHCTGAPTSSVFGASNNFADTSVSTVCTSIFYVCSQRAS